MSSVFIDHTLGEVFVERGDGRKKVDVKLTSESESFRLENGDIIMTGEEGYVVSTSERKEGKYSSGFKLGCNSRVSLDISTTISKIKMEKGWIVVDTNAPIKVPLVEIERVEDEKVRGSGDEIFVLIKVDPDQVKVANKGFPVDVSHKSETVRLMGHEQATATPSDLKFQSDADKEVRSILSKYMELDESMVGSVTDKVQENMKELEKEMRKMGIWDEVKGD